MPTYSMWWAISLRDWWLHTADLDAVRRNARYVSTLMANLAACVDADGRERLPAKFLDWASSRTPEAVAVGAHALTRTALLAGAELTAAAGDESAARKLARVADRVARHAPPPVPSQQANALRVIAGLANAESTNAEIFAPDPTAGLSPFYGYYVLEARAMAGDHTGALDLLRRYWGGMLDFGATSFWEHFDAAWLDVEPRPTRIDEWPVPGRADIHRDFGDHCFTGLRHSPVPRLEQRPDGVALAARFGHHPRRPRLPPRERPAEPGRPRLGRGAGADAVRPRPHPRRAEAGRRGRSERRLARGCRAARRGHRLERLRWDVLQKLSSRASAASRGTAGIESVCSARGPSTRCARLG